MTSFVEEATLRLNRQVGKQTLHQQAFRLAMKRGPSVRAMLGELETGWEAHLTVQAEIVDLVAQRTADHVMARMGYMR